LSVMMSLPLLNVNSTFCGLMQHISACMVL